MKESESILYDCVIYASPGVSALIPPSFSPSSDPPLPLTHLSSPCPFHFFITLLLNVKKNRGLSLESNYVKTTLKNLDVEVTTDWVTEVPLRHTVFRKPLSFSDPSVS